LCAHLLKIEIEHGEGITWKYCVRGSGDGFKRTIGSSGDKFG